MKKPCNKTKELIIDRLHDRVGKPTMRESSLLPDKIDKDDVLWAINLDEYFFKEGTSEQRNNT